MNILEIRDVERVHGIGEAAVHALRGVSLTVAPGELVAVMGPSGSGKSTLLNLAGGLDRPSTGTVSVEGEVLGTLSRRKLAVLRRRRVGYVFQDLNLLPSLTALENVALPLELDRAGVRAARRAALAALTDVAVADLARRFPDEMSGGQQQRVAIARALVGERRLILADEPTGALDSENGEAVLRLLRERVDAGAAGMLVTHEARHAAWADRVIFLRDGRIVDTSGPLPQAESLRVSRRMAGRLPGGGGTPGGEPVSAHGRQLGHRRRCRAVRRRPALQQPEPVDRLGTADHGGR
ncbi:MAG: ABC transporter ATP-binding protein [Micromonosporaceae bacterium]